MLVCCEELSRLPPFLFSLGKKGPIAPVTQADLDDISALRVPAFLNAVLEIHAGIGAF